MGHDNVPHGGFYTQDDVREVVAYAKARFITVVPEIEMPGHAQAAIAAYPELGNTGQQMEVLRRFGVNPNIFNPEESTVRFLQDVLTEVIALFPGKYVHIGGDEAVKDQWQASPRVQALIRERGLKDEHEMQSWFIHQMDAFLTAHGRSLIGWDEILEGGLAPNATVMSWRGMEGGIAAALAGHDVVMTPTSNTYLDYYQSQTGGRTAGGWRIPSDRYRLRVRAGARGAHGRAGRAHPRHAGPDLDRVPAHSQERRVYVFPRLLALAEVAWTPRDLRNLADFKARLSAHQRRLGILDVNYRPVN
jgi:hexosaminidase